MLIGIWLFDSAPPGMSTERPKTSTRPALAESDRRSGTRHSPHTPCAGGRFRLSVDRATSVARSRTRDLVQLYRQRSHTARAVGDVKVCSRPLEGSEGTLRDWSAFRLAGALRHPGPPAAQEAATEETSQQGWYTAVAARRLRLIGGEGAGDLSSEHGIPADFPRGTGLARTLSSAA